MLAKLVVHYMQYSKSVLSTTFAVAMILMSVPVVNASETVTEPYLLSAGASALGESAGAIVNPPSGYVPAPPPGWLIPAGWVGGAHLRTSTFYNSVVVSISDDAFGPDAASAACFWAFGSDELCDANDDVPSGASCGSYALIAPGLWRGAEATVWTFTVVVTDDLVVCGSSQGTVTGDFFNS